MENKVDEPSVEANLNIYKDTKVNYTKSTWHNGFIIAIAEFLGTALLVLLTCMGCTEKMFGEELAIGQKSMASGLSVMAAIQIFGHISGAHINPAITLCAAIMGEISMKSIPIYICAQIAGCIAGYALLMAVTSSEALDVVGHCATTPNSQITYLQACLVEFVATFIMALAICASWDARNASRGDSVPLRIGLLVFLLNISAGAYTGASMNPARSLGPNVWTGYQWESHWIYWIGPVAGACLAGYFYKRILNFVNVEINLP